MSPMDVTGRSAQMPSGNASPLSFSRPMISPTTPSIVGAISRMMHGIGRRYVAWFNETHARTGTLWEGRYKSCLVDTEDDVLACYRYIELNPVRAGFAAKPSEYAWSSYSINAFAQPGTFVRPHQAYLALGATATERSAAYQGLFHDALSEELLRDIRNYVQQQRALGTEHFRARVEARLGRASVRPVGRPKAL